MLDSINKESIKPLNEGSIDLFVESYSNAVRTVQVRGLTKNEVIIADHVTAGDRSLVAMSHPITYLPLSLTVRTAQTSVSRGECYVKVSLRVEGVVVALLFSGYVTDAGTQAYPGGKIESSVEGPGLIRSITGTDPAAGVEISETVPTGARWRLISLTTIFVADATVASRLAVLTPTDGANILLRSPGGSSITASQTVRISWGDFGARDSNTINGFLGAVGSLLYLMAGSVIATVTSSIQAGDNYGAPQMLVEEWIEP